MKEIGDYLDTKEVLFHIDATQSFGKLVDELKSIKYDMLSMSAHKINGPQGVGALILRKKHYKLPPVKNIMYGGQQERGLRPGTIPVALVAGLGKACEIAENPVLDSLEFDSIDALTKESIVRKVTSECKKNVIGALYEDFEGTIYSFDLKASCIIKKCR